MKNTLIIISLSLIMMSGCSKQEKDSNISAKETQQNIVVETNDDHNKPTAQFDQEKFVIDTFEEYGYTVPDQSKWIVKQEGPNKTAVIIKENINQKGKPNISKLIFIRNGEDIEILHLSIKNKVMI